MAIAAEKRARIHRMVIGKSVCPHGLKAKHLLESHGYAVDDVWLTTRDQTDAFMLQHGVSTTPQVFIGGKLAAMSMER